MDELQEILDLRRELEQANYEYYVLDAPAMSDYDFDHKLRRLEELEAAHPELISSDSPTQRVGGKVADGFAEVVHRVPLESLQDVFSFDELRSIDLRYYDEMSLAQYIDTYRPDIVICIRDDLNYLITTGNGRLS